MPVDPGQYPALLGARVKIIRQRLALGRLAFGRKLGWGFEDSDLVISTVGDLEAGEMGEIDFPALTALYRLAREAGLSREWLMFNAPPPRGVGFAGPGTPAAASEPSCQVPRAKCLEKTC